ncbi:MAG TPA: GDSL-type esterase/lipase family protein [Chitinophagaceae bacterium]|nr:GDSL-type esterase/lipase family protein [Chitinophagaceae bacterium]
MITRLKKIRSVFFLLVLCNAALSQTGKVYFTSKEITRVATGTNYFYHFAALDSNGNAVIYSVKKLPGWLHYNIHDNSISGRSIKTGQFPVVLVAHTKTDSAVQPFMVTVYDRQTENILCLGNSITNGVDTFNSYRRDLWQMLHQANYNFDFIGSWSKHSNGDNMPIPDFDLDHDGHSGWTFEDILNPPSWDSVRGNLYKWLQSYTPSSVLLELGTNDIFHCRTPKEMFINLDVIVGLLQEKNKHVRIFIAQIPPLGAQWSGKKLCGNDTSYAKAIMNLNREIAAYVKANISSQSPLITVDQFSGIDPSKDMFDDIHPNTRGEKLMAERWFKALQPYLKKL